MIRVLGIDAGFAAMGLACIDVDEKRVVAAETIRTERSTRKRGIRVADDDAERCQTLASVLDDFYRTHEPHLVVVELPTGGAQGARANRAMGMATGVVAAWVALHAIPAEWVTPGEVKRAAAGRKDATKAQVEEAVLEAFVWPENWGMRPTVEREHQADAAAAVMAVLDSSLLRAIRMGMARQEAG